MNVEKLIELRADYLKGRSSMPAVVLGLLESDPGAVVVDGAKLAECRREIAQARELLQAIAERFE